MSVKRLVTAGVVAVAVAVPVGVAASGPASSAAQSGATSTTLPTSRLDVPAEFSALASSAGISVSRLNAGLVAAKQAGGNSTAGIAAFAASAGVPATTAQRIVSMVFGGRDDRGLTGASASAALSKRLAISTTAAQTALQQIRALTGSGGLDPTSPAFASIARGVGVSPTQLAAALAEIKPMLAGR
jgi:hypothetical protein